MGTANLVLRFVLELAGVAALAYAGAQLPAALPLRALAALGLAGALVVTWALVAAPNTDNGLSQASKDVIGTALLLLAAAALGLAGQPVLAAAFGVAVLANAVIMLVLGPDARDAFERIA